MAATPLAGALAEAALPRLAAIFSWGGERRAILASPSGQAWGVAGDQIGTIRILTIDADSVRIESAGTQYVLTLDFDAAPVAAPEPLLQSDGVTFPGETRGIAVYAQTPAPD